MTVHSKLSIIGATAILLGLIGTVPFAYSTIGGNPASGASVPLPQQKPATEKPARIEGKPIRLQIPSLSMDLAVIDGFYEKNTGQWSLTDDKAQFATLSNQPNTEAGNTLIYGHNRKQVFERLYDLKPSAQVILYTENGHRFTYSYTSTEVVDPADTSIFEYQGKPRLTLQTCTGFWQDDRQFFYFKLVDAK